MNEHFDLLVIGGGPAGLAAARSYRATGGAGSAAIVTDEHRMPYRRPPLTKELLRGEMSVTELPIEDEAWLEAQRVTLIGGRAVALDPDAHVVRLSGGRALGYRHVIVATGAEPTRLPIPGADDPAVRTLRSLADLRELEDRLDPGAPVAVIGSGFLGCEIAASLRRRGHPLTMVSDEPAPNARRLGPRVAAELAGWLAEEGVELRLGAGAQRVDRHGGGLRVRAAAAEVPAVVVVMATGVAPRGELLWGRLPLDATGGAIPADTTMRTALPDVLAAGDVCAAVNAAAGRPLRVEHWGDALGQGAVAGACAAGAEARWDAVPGFWSTIGSRTLKYAAWGDGYDDCRFVGGGEAAFTTWYGRGGRVVGVLTHGRDEDYERGRELIAQGAPVPWH